MDGHSPPVVGTVFLAPQLYEHGLLLPAAALKFGSAVAQLGEVAAQFAAAALPPVVAAVVPFPVSFVT